MSKTVKMIRDRMLPGRHVVRDNEEAPIGYTMEVPDDAGTINRARRDGFILASEFEVKEAKQVAAIDKVIKRNKKSEEKK